MDVVMGQLEAGADRTSALHEEDHRFVLRERVEVERLAGTGQRQRSHRVIMLAIEAKESEAGCQHLQVWAGCEQFRYDRSRLNNLLEIVQHQEHFLAMQILFY